MHKVGRVLGGLLLAVCFAGSLPGVEPSIHEYESPLMGTIFRIRISTDDPDGAAKAAKLAFAEGARLEAIYSDYQAESDLSRVSRSPIGEPVKVAPELIRLLRSAVEYHRETHGAFDVTQGRAIREWRRAHRKGVLPRPEVRKEISEEGGVEHLTIERDTVARETDFLLDLGGIAKGETADRMLELLRVNGFPRAIVAASGDLRAGSAPHGQNGWDVEVAPFGNDHSKKYRVLLENSAISTSGDAHQFVEIEGQRYSHIVDPTTGLGLTTRRAAVVVSRKGESSDALATALCIMPAQNGAALLAKKEALEGLILEWEPDGKVRESRPEGGNARVIRSVPVAVIGPPSDELRRQFGLADFYQKAVQIGRFPIVGSASVPDEAFHEAHWILSQLKHSAASPILDHLARHKIRVVLMAHDELTSDIPEYQDKSEPRYWDRVSRGFGPSDKNPVVLVGVENLLSYAGDPYRGESVLLHETAHAIHRFGMGKAGLRLEIRLQQVFRKAKADGLWKDTRAVANHSEYFAEGVQCWFEANRTNDKTHNEIGTREELMKYDPRLGEILEEIFPDERAFRFSPVSGSPELTGWNQEDLPAFDWPPELDAWFRAKYPHLLGGPRR